jgi:hypothetical protein
LIGLNGATSPKALADVLGKPGVHTPLVECAKFGGVAACGARGAAKSANLQSWL